jgi:exportin-1
MPEFRNVTLKCLTEIGSLQTGQNNAYDEKLVQMFTEVLTTISKIIPLSLDLKSTYSSSNSKDQEFIQNLALFLTNFFGVHLNVRTPSLSFINLLTC